VFANYVYNDQVSGRPYLVGAIEDVAIVARFARERLGARRVHLRGRGDARLLAASAADGLGLEELPSDGEPAFRWSEAVERMQEVWPIHYLLPRGADYRAARRTPEGPTTERAGRRCPRPRAGRPGWPRR
jgi:hypothetical protein